MVLALRGGYCQLSLELIDALHQRSDLLGTTTRDLLRVKWGRLMGAGPRRRIDEGIAALKDTLMQIFLEYGDGFSRKPSFNPTYTESRSVEQGFQEDPT